MVKSQGMVQHRAWHGCFRWKWHLLACLILVGAMAGKAEESARFTMEDMVHPTTDKPERLSLAVLLRAMAARPEYRICHWQYRKDGFFQMERMWQIEGTEKREFLRRFLEWLGNEAVELTEQPVPNTLEKPWFALQAEEGHLLGRLVVYEMAARDDFGARIPHRRNIRIEYERFSENLHPRHYQWCGRRPFPDAPLPALPPGKAMRLHVPDIGADIGRCPAWIAHSVTFTIRNIGEDAVKLTRAGSLSNGIKIQFQPCVLPPGGKATLTAIVQPNALLNKFKREVFLETDAPGQECMTFTVAGHPIPALMVIPSHSEVRDADGHPLPGPFILENAHGVTGVMAEERRVWLGYLRLGEERVQRFLLTPYESLKPVLKPTAESGDGAKARLFFDEGVCWLEITVRPREKVRNAVVYRTIGFESTDPDKGQELPAPLTFAVGYSMADVKAP